MQAQTTGDIATRGRDSGPLGTRLQGIQRFGLTVRNMDRAFEFYTEVLGGTEVMRDGDFHGEPIHNTLMTDQEILAREQKTDPRTIGVPDLKGGTQRLCPPYDTQLTSGTEERRRRPLSVRPDASVSAYGDDGTRFVYA